MCSLKQYVLAALILLAFICSSCSAFHMHKIMAAALLANSLQRTPFVPLPIPIPIPVKVGGNTIVAMGDGDEDYYHIPLNKGCSRPPCYSGHHGRRIDIW